MQKLFNKVVRVSLILVGSCSLLYGQPKLIHKKSSTGKKHIPLHNLHQHNLADKQKLHNQLSPYIFHDNRAVIATQASVTKEINFNGQWRGGFIDNSTAFIGFGGDKIEYVLELETHGSSVTGYSYTYFSEGSKRYYTICKVKGSINRTTKEVVVTEFERTKFNTPPDFRNCFQVHKLKYNKDNPEEESLEGTWYPAPTQEGDCGYGKTTLTRKIVPRITIEEIRKNTPDPVKKGQFSDMNREQKPVTLLKPKPVIKDLVKKTITDTPKTPAKIYPPIVQNEVKKESPVKDTIVKRRVATEPPKKEVSDLGHGKFEKRDNTVLETINIVNETFTVDFYDDGVVDGDSISVFYNGKLILSKKMLSLTPITLTLKVDPTKKINELVMYAENLGEIPPNTALMIVRDGDNRYEARIVSDMERSGTIRFTHNPK